VFKVVLYALPMKKKLRSLGDEEGVLDEEEVD
jgi:hypothetical protein